jgi:hypothetical protein
MLIKEKMVTLFVVVAAALLVFLLSFVVGHLLLQVSFVQEKFSTFDDRVFLSDDDSRVVLQETTETSGGLRPGGPTAVTLEINYCSSYCGDGVVEEGEEECDDGTHCEDGQP